MYRLYNRTSDIIQSLLCSCNGTVFYRYHITGQSYDLYSDYEGKFSMFHFTDYPVQINLLHLVIANDFVLLIFIISTLASSRALFKVNARDLVQE
jgi:hypothetical protein